MRLFCERGMKSVFFNSKNFKTLEAGVQLTWMQQQLHMQNLANVETPGYKAKSLVFDSVLENAQNSAQAPDVIRARVVADENVSVLQDGNNVDVEAENMELYKAYAQYSMLLDKVKGQFNNYNTVLNSNMK